MKAIGVVAALAAAAVAACSSSGVSPKAFGREAGSFQPVAAETGLDPNVAEPVVVAPEVIEGFQFLYRFITEVEFVLCLEGERKNGRLHVDAFRLARMEATSVNSVRYQPCTGARYVGTAHNHPPVGQDKSLCYQSEPDRRSFAMDERAVVDLVLCGSDQYYWALKDGRTGAAHALASNAD
ncbi:MAG TPA: hypothetical protein VGD27_06010 [Longimicrobiales bacterium]